MRRLGSELEFLRVVALLLGSVGGPRGRSPSGYLGKVELVDLGEGEAAGLRDEEEHVNREEGDSLEKREKRSEK